jgi:riboflavin kinase / FMN adenylyltransferase
VVSIGVFDGVHLGHQAILCANLARASALGARPTVVTFDSHPKGTLLGHAPRTLTGLEHRLELFRRAGIEHTLVLAFDAALRSVSAEQFTRDTLLAGLDARAFVLGFDSKFGRDRRGTPELLRTMGLDVQVVEKVEIGGRAVSSTAIREAVELGDLESAARMLGRPVSVLGTVVRGAGLGRKLGFPTANLDLHHELHPPPGVYAGLATLLAPPDQPSKAVSETGLPAVANIGFRPTVERDQPAEPRLEVHLLDFEGDLYGRDIEFAFLRALRGEVRFAGPQALAEQIAADVAEARALLSAGR